jgi:hypothetical protein
MVQIELGESLLVIVRGIGYIVHYSITAWQRLKQVLRVATAKNSLTLELPAQFDVRHPAINHYRARSQNVHHGYNGSSNFSFPHRALTLR